MNDPELETDIERCNGSRGVGKTERGRNAKIHFVDSELLTQEVQEREYCVCDIAVYVQQRSPALQFVSCYFLRPPCPSNFIRLLLHIFA